MHMLQWTHLILQVNYIQGSVDNIDKAGNKVIYSSQGSKDNELAYDYLVVSPGAQPRLDMIPGAREYAIPFYQAENAYALRLKLERLQSTKRDLIRVAVVGAGYSGVEIASNVAEYLGKRGNVILIDRNNKLLASSPEHNRKTSQRYVTVNISLI
jgi:demethylphylloquinone reductase